MENQLPRGNGIGGLVPDGWYLRHEAAEMIGRDKDTLKRWHRLGLKELENKVPNPQYVGAIPSGQMPAGRLEVWLYNDDDIENLRVIASTRHPGGRKQAS